MDTMDTLIADASAATVPSYRCRGSWALSYLERQVRRSCARSNFCSALVSKRAWPVGCICTDLCAGCAWASSFISFHEAGRGAALDILGRSWAGGSQHCAVEISECPPLHPSCTAHLSLDASSPNQHHGTAQSVCSVSLPPPLPSLVLWLK